LCDEVGLGKTIEAGLVLKEYLVRNIVQRALIITPAALVEQWREELATKFGLPDFITTTDPQFRAAGPHAWEQFPRLIASLATARRVEHRPRIVQIPYDLVIVDEAHHLKNRASASWKFVNELQRKYLLLLTATPVENNLDELYNLITLLKPGQLSTPREFRRRFVVHGDPRHLKNRAQLRELLGDVMVRHSRSQVNIQLPPRRANTVRLQLTPPEADFYAAVSAMVRSQFQNQAGSAYLDEIGAFPDSNGSALKQTDRFTLLTLQREIGSSPQAAESTLRSLAARATTPAQRDQLSSLAAQSGRISTWAKADALEKLLHSIFREGTTAQNRTEKVLIFTHFRRTLELLATRLQAQGVDFVAYHGELTAAAKQQAIDDFESHVQVLLSTEAAGEGRNLQFCRTMVNFDIPWNPMRIEQRVGRIHRVGQDRPVQIYNLSARGTVEDYLLQLIDQKLNMFELVIGEMDMILGHLTDERDFEDVLIDVWLQGRNESEIQAGFNQLGDRLIQARQAYQASRDYDEALFGEDFSTE
jgi:SNF2 family DNA or RNA helicase